MKSYSVVYTASARDDVFAAVDYIANDLLDNGAANRLIDNIQNVTERLKVFPESSPLVNDKILRNRGIRAAVITGYILFYKVDDSKESIYIIRFLHSTQDSANLLLAE